MSGSRDLAVEVRGLTKHFRRKRIRGGHTTLKSHLVNLITRKSATSQWVQNDVQVLRGVDLEVPAGKTVGIIGQNGSGKSTLLKILCGIYRPTSGVVKVNGRISALLELGAGFHPDFSGRENIEINGVILGLSRAEIRAKMDEIIAYSELEEFIDQPVRTYSSGMYMRLAFSVATFVDPEVLIVDEILSVGDEHFGRKSRAKMEEFKERGKTILLVTHDLGTVDRWCDLAAWVDDGEIAAFGPPGRVIAAYRQRVAEREMDGASTGPVTALGIPEAQSAAQTLELGQQPSAPAPIAVEPAPPAAAVPDETRWGNRQVVIHAVRLLDGEGRPTRVFDPESRLTIEMDFESVPGIRDVGFGIAIFNDEGVHVYGTNTFIEKVEPPLPLPPVGTVRVVVDRLGLNDDNYVMDVATHAKEGLVYDYQKGQHAFAVRSSVRDVGIVRLPHRWSIHTSASQLRSVP